MMLTGSQASRAETTGRTQTNTLGRKDSGLIAPSHQ